MEGDELSLTRLANQWDGQTKENGSYYHREKKAHSGTWTHNLLLRRQAPYPIRLCVLVELSLPVQINEAPTKSTQRKLMKETENEKKLRIAVGKYTRYALVSPVR